LTNFSHEIKIPKGNIYGPFQGNKKEIKHIIKLGTPLLVVVENIGNKLDPKTKCE
jgi:hypothetical protein